MRPRDWRVRIEDILDAISKIERYIGGMDFDAFAGDERTIDATVRNLEIIGEAARHVPDEVTVRFPEVPWADMRAMRNVLTHEYFGVNRSILWRTVTHDLPPLKPQLARLLDDGEAGS